MVSKSQPLRLKSKRIPSECQVCAKPALYSYFGAIVCVSCKMFFKRYANHQTKKLICQSDGHCTISRDVTQLCSYCRLAKCFSIGMQVEMIRGCMPKSYRQKNQGSSTTLAYGQQIARINLLRSDQSNLNSSQWTLLTNLMQCYELCHPSYPLDQYLSEQNQLPVKMRYKNEQAVSIAMRLASTGHLLYEKNADFLSLNPYTRSFLLQKTIRAVLACNSAFITNMYQFFEDPICYQTMVSIYGQTIIDNGRMAGHLLRSDPVFVKLIVLILMFFPFDFSMCDQEVTTMRRELTKIQDTYVELAWKYMLYKYGDQRTVILFSKIIRALFCLSSSISSALELPVYHDMIDSLVEQTEKGMNLENTFAE